MLIYNSQVSEKLTERLRDIAGKAKVPVVGVTETMPANVSFQDWVLGELRRARQGTKRAEFVSIVALDRATLRIAGRAVLSDVSLDIEAGEFIGVLGPTAQARPR